MATISATQVELEVRTNKDRCLENPKINWHLQSLSMELQIMVRNPGIFLHNDCAIVAGLMVSRIA